MNQHELKQPFFAQFLQGQKKTEEKQQQNSSPNGPAVTLKYPSDRDEDPRDF